MKTNEVETFKKLQPQLKSAYDELKLLSNKKPNESVNNFKLKFINSILSKTNEILGEKYKPFPEEFNLFDKDDIPNNSDVVFILSHYLTSLEKLRCDNIEQDVSYDWYWLVNGKRSSIETDEPTIK